MKRTFGEVNILMVSGTHGDETNAVQDVYTFKTQNSKRKNIQYLQAWNKSALASHTREFQAEDLSIPNDMNRAFKSPEAVSKEDLIQLAKNSIKEADIVIDVHNSELLRNCVVINNDFYAEAYVKFCKKYSIPFIIIESCTDTIKKYSLDSGRIAFTVEIGDMNFSDRDDGVDFLRNLIEALEKEYETVGLGILDTKSSPFVNVKVSQFLVAHSAGLLRVYNSSEKTSKPKRSEVLRSYHTYDTIFVIVDPADGTIKEIVKAPCDGALLDVFDSYWVTPGAVIGSYQPNA